MAFHDRATFPTEFDFSSISGPTWSTAQSEYDSGSGRRIQTRGSKGRMKFEGRRSALANADAWALHNFVRARHGAAAAFRFKSWSDFTSHPDGISDGSAVADRQNIATGTGQDEEFQVYKFYDDADGYQFARKITRLVDGTTRAWVAGTEQTYGTQFFVDIDTGVIKFATAPADGAAIDVSFEFDTPVRISTSADEGMAFSQVGANHQTVELSLVEVEDQLEGDERRHCGGSFHYAQGDPISQTHWHRFEDAFAVLFDEIPVVRLPNEANIPDGGPYCVFFASGIYPGTAGNTNSFTGTPVTTFSAGSCAQFFYRAGVGWTAVGA